MVITHAIITGEIEKEEIKIIWQWLLRNYKTMFDKERIHQNLVKLAKAYSKDRDLGSFLEAIRTNDFVTAVLKIPEDDIKELKIYAWFMNEFYPRNAY